MGGGGGGGFTYIGDKVCVGGVGRFLSVSNEWVQLHLELIIGGVISSAHLSLIHSIEN